MTTERIDIVVKEDGSVVVKRRLEDVGKAASGTDQLLRTLRGTLAALGVAKLVGEVFRLANTFQELQNKLRVVTGSQEELVSVTDKLFDIAQRTRGSFESTTTLYSRLALSTKQLGISQEQLLGFTESLNQAITLSGATTQEASAGLIQLSQGMALGVLRGQDLRSVMEQIPAVADVIAKGLHVTRGELLTLGEQGKISAADIVRAFQNARQELNERFAKTVPTLGQAFEVLHNAILRAADADLGPLTGAITDLAIQISDPTFQQAFGTLVSGLVKIAGLAFDGLKIFVQIGEGIGVAAARLQGFADAEDQLGSLDSSINKTKVEIAAMYRAIDEGDVSVKNGTKQIEEFEKRLKSLQDARPFVVKELQSTPKGVPEPKTVKPPPDLAGGATKIDAETLKQQQRFLQNLHDQATELALQVTLGDKAGDAISRYGLAVKLVATKATPELVAEATALNESIIGLQHSVEQSTFTKSLTEQSGALTIQAQAGDRSSEALFKYQAALEASKIGGVDFVARIDKITDAIIAQQDAITRNKITSDLQNQTAELAVQIGALQAQTRAGDDAGEALYRYQQAIEAARVGDVAFVKENQKMTDSIILQRHVLSDTAFLNSLQQEVQLIGMTNQQRAIEIELRKLSKDATDAQKQSVAEYVQKLLDEDQAHKILQDVIYNSNQQVLERARVYKLVNEEIAKLLAEGVLNEKEAARARRDAWFQEHQDVIQGYRGFFNDLAVLATSSNKRLAKIGKAAAIATAIIDGIVAVQKALAAPPGPPVSYAFAAAAGLVAAVNVAKIRAQQETAGYMSGGYTGNGAVNAVVGSVHGQEYVMDAVTTSRVGVQNLDALRSGQARLTSKSGSSGTVGGRPVNVTIQNYGTSKSFDVQQLTPEDVRIIARDEAEQQVVQKSPKVIAGQLGDPNSTVSKSLSKNVATRRNR